MPPCVAERGGGGPNHPLAETLLLHYQKQTIFYSGLSLNGHERNKLQKPFILLQFSSEFKMPSIFFQRV